MDIPLLGKRDYSVREGGGELPVGLSVEPRPVSDRAKGYPRSSEISAALAALGVYAQNPSAQDLEEQAHAAGGESVLTRSGSGSRGYFAPPDGFLTIGPPWITHPGKPRSDRDFAVRMEAAACIGARCAPSSGSGAPWYGETRC